VDEREILTWDAFGRASDELAAQVRDSGYVPQALLGIARGGLPLLGSLGYSLGIKRCFLMNIEFYTGVDERLEAPLVLPPALQLGDLTNLSILVVDDVADTGATLEMVRDLCVPHVAEVRTGVLYQKPQSVIMADYAWKTTNEWITFPWSSGDYGPVDDAGQGRSDVSFPA
jgi:uncharacterized protein